MPLFKYKAIDSAGEQITGSLEATDKNALYKDLISKGTTIISVKAPGDRKSILSIFSISFGGVKIEDKIIFAKNLSQMIDAGLPITRGLSIMERQAKKGTFRDILLSLNEALGRGETLSDAMKKYPNVSIVLGGSTIHNSSSFLSEFL